MFSLIFIRKDSSTVMNLVLRGVQASHKMSASLSTPMVIHAKVWFPASYILVAKFWNDHRKRFGLNKCD